MAEFNQEQAIKEYTELSRLMSIGAYSERSTEDFETGTYPEDGIEESIDNLTELAAEQGLEFSWHEESGTWCLDPMSEETRAARQAAQGDEPPGDDIESIEQHIQELNEQEKNEWAGNDW